MTTDHVIPGCLYPLSKASSKIQRITVPACFKCNNGWANDEPHFRNVMLVSGDTSPIVQELWNKKALPSFSYKDGFKRARDIHVQIVPVKTADGDRGMIFPAKDPRVMRIIRKIARGLCAHHGFLHPVSDEQVWADVQRHEVPEEILRGMKYSHVEEDIFQYHYSLISDHDMHSGWLFRFFNRTTFFCIIYPSVEAQRSSVA